ncbi:MAG TPA: hypothetical protein VIL42_07515 [Sphingomicrobium sp.]|jgi:energy-coupling factor transporter ATP-binding protein EcfA2
MKLLRYQAAGLNHSRQVDVRLNGDLTFITGVNGTGKTSLLATLVALLAPDLQVLAHIPFLTIRIDFELGSKKCFVKAQKSDQGVVSISCSGVKEPFEYVKYEEDLFSSESREARSSYYTSLRVQLGSHPVFSFLSTVPTPMYLGLDRQYRTDSATDSRYAARSFARRRKRNVFGSVLGASLSQAIGLAEDRYALVQNRTGVFRSEFLRDLLLSLISLPTHSGFGSIQVPTAQERALPTKAQKALRRFPRVEGISAEAVRSRVEPIIENITKVLAVIPQEFDLANLSVHKSEEREIGPTKICSRSRDHTNPSLEALGDQLCVG